MKPNYRISHFGKWSLLLSLSLVSLSTPHCLWADETQDRITQLEQALNDLAVQNNNLQKQLQDLKAMVGSGTNGSSSSTASAPIADTPAQVGSSPEESIPKDQLKLNWDGGIEFESADGTAKGEIGGRFHWDVLGFDADRELEAAHPGELDGGTQFRRLRMSAEGQYGLELPMIYKVDVDFAGGNTVLKDTFIGIRDIPYVGKIRLGHLKEPFSMEELGSSKHMGYVERASLNEALVPSRNNGVEVSNMAMDDRMGWAAGWFAEVPSQNINEIDGNHRVTGRLFGVPYKSGEVERPSMWHVGMAGSYANVQDEENRFRAKPEANMAPRVVDTGLFASDSYYLGGVETALVHGPYSIQAEYVHNRSNGLNGGGHADFSGWYAYASWFLTGESRYDAYKPKFGFFDRVKPRENFSLLNKGLGAWELILRYSDLDLNDAGIAGGEMSVWTAGLNWYLSPSVRAIFNYGLADVARPGQSGKTDIAQFRFLVNF
jgi:phosphate-selective porin OprO and OprP